MPNKPETAATDRLSNRSEDTARLAQRYSLPEDVAQRIVEMATSIDQAHSIAELMR